MGTTVLDPSGSPDSTESSPDSPESCHSLSMKGTAIILALLLCFILTITEARSPVGERYYPAGAGTEFYYEGCANGQGLRCGAGLQAAGLSVTASGPADGPPQVRAAVLPVENLTFF